jgi:hypothetical protein
MAYIAITKVQHNGKFFEIGDEVSGLKEKDVERLLELESIEDDDKKAKKEVVKLDPPVTE